MYSVRTNIITLHKQRKRLEYHIKMSGARVVKDELGTTIYLSDQIKMTYSGAETIEDYQTLINWIKNAG
jgi:hypothetical protein